jgi:hypothetical protein
MILTGFTVQGRCPMGCGETLILAEGGFATCSSLSCPRPAAASELLADGEAAHIVQLGETDFTIRHPLHERLDDALMQCELHVHVAALPGPPRQPGRYRVRASGPDMWSWEQA